MTDRNAATSRNLLDELLVQRATEPLGEEDAANLDELLDAFPAVDADAFERAAAAVWLAAASASRDEMPAALRKRIIANAGKKSRRD